MTPPCLFEYYIQVLHSLLDFWPYRCDALRQRSADVAGVPVARDSLCCWSAGVPVMVRVIQKP